MTNFVPGWAAYPVIACSLAITLGLLLWKLKSLRGLTLMGPWWWIVIAVVSIASVETLIHFHADYAARPLSEPLRFIALTSLFTPLISLLGAKRPQDGAWHFVVASLWAILALPAAETLFLQRGQALEVYDARCWFLLALIVISALNIGLVRWWPAALLIALAELLTLAEYLPWLRASAVATQASEDRIAAGCLLLLAATVLAAFGIPRQRSVPPWDRLWLAFRDSFGALWAIRIAEQINQVAGQQQWAFRLHWQGFRNIRGEPLSESPFEQQPVLAQVVENLFRRFVNAAWIERHLGRPLADYKPAKR